MDITTLAAAKAYTDKKTSESGGSSLVAGDLLEIKDGVVRCTLGDLKSGELKEEIDEIFGLDSIPEMEMVSPDGYPSVYVYGTDSMDKFPKLNEKLTIEFTKSNGEKKTFEVDVEGEADESYGEMWAYYNCEEIEVGKELLLTKIDENLDAIYLFICYSNDEEDPFTDFAIQTFEDFTGASLFVGYKTVTDTKEYVLLPDTALGLGREIVTEINEEIVNVESIEMYYEDGMGSTYFTLSEFPQIGTTVDVQFTPVDATEPIHYTAELIEFPPLSYDEFVSCAACCNASFTEDGITVIDESLPGFILATADADGNDEGCFFGFLSTTDYNGASIVINNKAVIKTRVTLPNEALNFDSEPTEGSTNLVNSGDLYNFIGDIQTIIAQINTLIGGAS